MFLERAEKAFTVIALVIYTGAILVLVMSGGEQENEFVEFDSSLIRVINFFLYMVTYFLLLLRWKRTLYVLSKDRWITLLLMLTVFSLAWSFERGTTLKNSFTMVGSSAFGLYLACRYTLKEQLQILGIVFGVIVGLSFVFAIALPRYGVMGGIHHGKWRGVFLHKNGLGSRMVTSGIVFFLLGYQTTKRRWLYWLGFFLSIALVQLSVSTSSLFNLFILIFAFFIFQTLRLPYDVMMPTLAMLSALGEGLYYFFTNNAAALFNSVGKDATLTGRTDLWPLVLDMIWKQPWLGYGYGGFWQGFNGESSYVWWASGWTPTHPHNGFLNLWLDLGILGLTVFFLGFFQCVIRGIAWANFSQTVDGIWPLIHLTYLVIANLTESSLFDSNDIVWILYVAVVFSLGVTPKEKSKVLTPADW